MTGRARIDLGDWVEIAREPKGAKEKYWMQDPAADSDALAGHWLFKIAKTQENGVRQLGDWTEVVVSELSEHLGVPCAEASLAIRDGREGVIVRNLRLEGMDFINGDLMLADLGVDVGSSSRVQGASRGHTLENVFQALEGLGAPAAAESWQGCAAYDVFVGYLLLDALVGNGDRHEKNWSVMRATSTLGGVIDTLAPSYDMEASLGFNLSDERRRTIRGDTNSMERFLLGGRGRKFYGESTLTLVDLAAREAARCSPLGRARISELVDAVERFDYHDWLVYDETVSEDARMFAIEVLNGNGRRIRDAFVD